MSERLEAVIAVRLTPRASRNEAGAWVGDALQVRVMAPAIDGRANEALCRLLAELLDVAPSRLSIVSGERGRTKRVRIEGLGLEEARRRLGG